MRIILSFLVVALICSPSTSIVFAAKPDYCFENDCPGRLCDNNPAKGTATCCWSKPGVIPPEPTCQTCHVNTETGEFENCTDVHSKGRPGIGIIAPPPSGVAPPPSTTTCPDITALDANGNCAPLTQAPTDQATTQPPINDNTNTKHHKGSNLDQLGGSVVNGDNSSSPSTSTGDNNDKPSKHHKG